MDAPLVPSRRTAVVTCSCRPLRFLIVALAFWMALCGGSQYAYPALEVHWMQKCDLTAEQIDSMYAAGALGLGCGLVPGLIYQSKGPAASGMYAAILVFVAARMLGNSTQLQDHCGGAWRLSVLRFALQNGSSALYQTGLFAATAVAPAGMRGMVVGIISSGFGLSAAFWSAVYEQACHSDLQTHYSVISWAFSGTAVLGAALLPALTRRLTPPEACVEAGVAQSPVAPDVQPPIRMHPVAVLQSPNFWAFIAIFVLSEAMGQSVFISNMSLMGRSLGIGEAQQELNVHLFSCLNCGARMACGALIDCCHARGVPVIAHTIWSSLLMIAAVALILFAPDAMVGSVFSPALAIMACGYGAYFALLPAYNAFAFGAENMWVTFNTGVFVLGVTVIVVDPRVGRLYDEALARPGGCSGRECWSEALSVALLVACTTLGLALLQTWRSRRHGN